MKNSKRIIHIDYLRAFVIMLVVSFHVSLSFMAKSPKWWYVKSEESSIIFTLLVVIADVFMMPLLFFIAGYVLPIYQIDDKTSLLLKKRIIKLGFPWIFCTILFAPFLSLYIADAMGHNITYIQMISSLFWTKEYYYQGPYWFLGILLSLQAIIILVNRFNKLASFINNIPTSLIWAMLLVIPAIGYSVGSYFYGVDNWESLIYLWSFQPSKILTYICYFLAGYVLHIKKLSPIINIRTSLACTLILSFIFIILKGRFENATDFSSFLLQGLTYSGLALFATSLLFAVFSRLFTIPNSFFSFLSHHTFVIYLVHLPIQVLTADFIIKTIPGIYLQWILLFSLTIILSIMVSYAVKIPCLLKKPKNILQIT